MKVAVLLLSILLSCEGSRLREGFKKLFKREPKKCDIIWTEQVHPHCEITHEKVMHWKSGPKFSMKHVVAGLRGGVPGWVPHRLHRGVQGDIRGDLQDRVLDGLQARISRDLQHGILNRVQDWLHPGIWHWLKLFRLQWWDLTSGQYSQECSSHPHCEMVEEEKCSTK